MSDPSRILIQLAAASATAVAAVQAVAGAGNLVLSGGANFVAGPTQVGGFTLSNYAKMDVARRVLLTDTLTTDTAVVFTISGLNRDLQPISETITGLSTTLFSVNDYLYVTSIAVSAATNGSISAGTNGVGSTPWVLCNPYSTTWQLSAAGVLISGSAGTFTFDWTYDDPNASINQPMGGFIPEASSAVPPLALFSSSQTLTNPFPGAASFNELQYTGKPIMAHRLTITSGTGLVAFYSLQGGIKS